MIVTSIKQERTGQIGRVCPTQSITSVTSRKYKAQMEALIMLVRRTGRESCEDDCLAIS